MEIPSHLIAVLTRMQADIVFVLRYVRTPGLVGQQMSIAAGALRKDQPSQTAALRSVLLRAINND